jgi:uncharacterized protein (TIGR03067 family)
VDASPDRGAIWLKDLEIVKTPSAEFLELQRLQGTWQAVQGEYDGKPLTEEELKRWKIQVAQNDFDLACTIGDYEGKVASLKLDGFPHDATIDVAKRLGQNWQQLFYDLDGDTWKVCGPPPAVYERIFDAKAGSKRWLVTFKRVPTGKPAADEVVLKKFDPKTDKPVTKEVSSRKVTVENDEWKIELLGLNDLGSLDQVARVHLFEMPGPASEPSRVTLRFKVKTEDVFDARFELHLRYPNIDDMVFKGRRIEGSTNWTVHEISWDNSKFKLQKPEALAFDLVMRAKDVTTKAIVSLKDVELVKTPLSDK